MKKQAYLSLVFLSVSVSFPVFADTSILSAPGIYAGVEGGFSQVNANYPPFVNAPISNFNSVNTPDLVVGPHSYYYYVLLKGPTVTNTQSTQLTKQTEINGMGGRLYVGYQFNPYFSIETAFTNYGKVSFSGNYRHIATQDVFAYYDDDTDNPNFNYHLTTDNFQTATTNTSLSGETKEHQLELVARGNLPLPHDFQLYADAGIAYVTAITNLNGITNATLSTQTMVQETQTNAFGTKIYTFTNGPVIAMTGNGDSVNLYSKTYHGFRPVGGLGASYAIPNSHIYVNIFYNQLFSSGVIPRADLWGAGVGYKFA